MNAGESMRLLMPKHLVIIYSFILTARLPILEVTKDGVFLEYQGRNHSIRRAAELIRKYR